METKFDLLVSSTGRVGSTMLLDFISEFNTTNPNHFNLTKNADGRYKHIIVPPNEPIANKAIFLYGNVYNVLISLHANDRLPRINFINREIPMPPIFQDKFLPLASYLEDGKDWFLIKKQIKRWKKDKTPYPRMLIKYESMHNHIPEILEFCDIDQKMVKEFPPYHPRKSNYMDHPCKDRLIEVYGKVQEYIDKQPEIEIILP